MEIVIGILIGLGIVLLITGCVFVYWLGINNGRRGLPATEAGIQEKVIEIVNGLEKQMRKELGEALLKQKVRNDKLEEENAEIKSRIWERENMVVSKGKPFRKPIMTQADRNETIPTGGNLIPGNLSESEKEYLRMFFGDKN